MKTTIVKATNVDFQPVTLQITFQTEKEIKLFKDMCSWNMTIPKLITDETEEGANYKILRDTLDNIREALAGR
jgi:hypothetical protein